MTGQPSSEPAGAGDPDGGGGFALRGRGRRLLLAVAVALTLLLGLDLARSPERQLSARVLLAAIDLYQASLSPALARHGVACRFRPSCSRYAEGVIRKHGALGGVLRTAWRILRCGPWTEAGTYDPP